MKEEIANENTASFSHIPTPAQLRAATKIKDSLRAEAVNRVPTGSIARPRRVVAEPNNTHRARVLGPNKFRGGDEMGVRKSTEMEETKYVARNGSQPVELFARLPRRLDSTSKSIEEPDTQIKQLRQRLDMSETLVQELKSETTELKAEVEKLQNLNADLEAKNRRLEEDLAKAEANVAALSCHDQEKSMVIEVLNPKFRDVQKLMANKLEHLQVKAGTNHRVIAKVQALTPKSTTKAVAIQPQVLINGPPPPPPLPLPRNPPSKASTMQRAPALVQFYQFLNKRDAKKNTSGNGNLSSPVPANTHNSIVGEIQNRSAHLLAIKTDIETKGDFIKLLIQKVHSASYTDIEDVLTFVDWLDRELSTLADERAVLKHFNWPERKADAMREAAFEYRDIKQLHTEILSYEDDASIQCEAALKKITNLLDKLERKIERLIKLRDLSMPCYKDYKIPTDWMLDSGMVSKIKLATVKLAKLYMKRVSMEIESIRLPEKKSVQEALLHQSVRFAYRVHQFAGGLNAETMCAFEDMKRRASSKGESL